MMAFTLSLFMLAGIALGLGGIYLIAARRDPKRGWLMIVAAVVMFGNVAIWSWPMPGSPPVPGAGARPRR